MAAVIIRPLSATDSISAITQLLHSAYAQLAAKGFRYLATHQNDATTARRLREGHAWVATMGDEIVGTITLYRSNPNDSCEWYRQPHVWHFGQFGVRPDLQKQGIGLRLHQQIESFAADNGAVELALDTAEGAHHLRRWYEDLGYRLITYESWDVTNYRSVIMSKALKKNPPTGVGGLLVSADF